MSLTRGVSDVDFSLWLDIGSVGKLSDRLECCDIMHHIV